MRDAQLRPRILRIQACLSGCLDSNGLSLTCLGSHQHVASSCLTLCHALCSGLARLRPSSGPWLPFPAPRAFLLCSHGLVRTMPCCFQSYLVLVRNGFLDDSLPHWGHSPCGLLVPAQQLPGLCFRAGSVFTCQCPCLGVVASWPTPQEPHSATSPGTLPELPGQQQAAWEEWGSQFFVAGCGSGAACGSFRRTPPSLVSPSLRQGSE